MTEQEGPAYSPDSVILTAGGTPFQTEASAKSVRSSKKLNELIHKVIPYDGGWAILRPEALQAVLADAAANKTAAAPTQPVGPSPEDKVVVIEPDTETETEGGAVHQPSSVEGHDLKPVDMMVTEGKERVKRTVFVEPDLYYRVKFQGKSAEHDPEDVQLTVNNKSLVMQRGEWVIIPLRFKVAADNAVYPTYSHKPGQGRKQTGERKHFPYELSGEATKAEYLEHKRKGTAIAKQLAGMTT